MARICLLYQKFGWLRVVGARDRTRWGQAKWLCECQCGKRVIVTAWDLKSGQTKSCGCLRRITSSERKFDFLGKRLRGALVVDLAKSSKWQHAMWRCICKCGATYFAYGYKLKRGMSQACRTCSNPHFLHGASIKGSPMRSTYNSYRAMIARCTNPSVDSYEIYGGAGVKVCRRWLSKKNGFVNFVEDLRMRPPGTSIGRFGDVGNYEPGNVKWMTKPEQSATRRAKYAKLRKRRKRARLIPRIERRTLRSMFRQALRS